MPFGQLKSFLKILIGVPYDTCSRSRPPCGVESISRCPRFRHGEQVLFHQGHTGRQDIPEVVLHTGHFPAIRPVQRHIFPVGQLIRLGGVQQRLKFLMQSFLISHMFQQILRPEAVMGRAAARQQIPPQQQMVNGFHGRSLRFPITPRFWALSGGDCPGR